MYRCLCFLLLLAGPLAAQELLSDSWKKLPDKDPLRHSPSWDLISDGGTADWAPGERGRILRLSNGLRIRSRAVSPFTPANFLSGRWAFTQPAGSAGIGLIDFATNVFFYLYANAADNTLVLVRGAGEETTELHRSAFTPGATPHTYTLTVHYQEKTAPKFTIAVDGAAVATEIPDPSATAPSSNFYVYFGVSGGGSVDCHELTAVRNPASPSKNWLW